MKSGDFIRTVRKLAKERNVHFAFDERGGKGSHGKLYFGDKRTIVKDRRKELGKGLLHSMLKQLGLTPDDIR